MCIVNDSDISVSRRNLATMDGVAAERTHKLAVTRDYISQPRLSKCALPINASVGKPGAAIYF